MKKADLLKRKEELTQQREMAIAQLQQIVGALAMLDELINKSEEEVEESIKKTSKTD